MDRKKDFDYELIDSFEYADKSGELNTAQLIKLLAPTAKNMSECAALKQFFMRALPESNIDPEKIAEAKEALKNSKADETLDGEEMMLMISRSPDVDLSAVLVTARELFTRGERALVDGEVKLTKPLCDLMSMDDLEKMTGEYLANFIMASSLNKMNGM